MPERVEGLSQGTKNFRADGGKEQSQGSSGRESLEEAKQRLFRIIEREMKVAESNPTEVKELEVDVASQEAFALCKTIREVEGLSSELETKYFGGALVNPDSKSGVVAGVPADSESLLGILR